MEESCIEQQEALYLDDRGYLMNDRGEYILDHDGNQVHLSQEHIQALRDKGMLMKL